MYVARPSRISCCLPTAVSPTRRKHNPESVNSVMMIMAFIFEQMSCYFEGAMGVHCNREVARQMSQRNPV